MPATFMSVRHYLKQCGNAAVPRSRFVTALFRTLPMSFKSGFIVTRTLLSLAHNDAQNHLWLWELGVEPGNDITA